MWHPYRNVCEQEGNEKDVFYGMEELLTLLQCFTFNNDKKETQVFDVQLSRLTRCDKILLFSSSIRAHYKALSCLCVSFVFLTRFWVQISSGVFVITVPAF